MRNTKLSPIWLALSSALLISACATQSSLESTDTGTIGAPDSVQTKVEIPAKPLTGETLFQIMLAEIAINREEFGLAANLYSQLALRDPDIGVLERGVALNQSIRNYQQSAALAQLWVSKDTNNEAAWRALAITSLSNQDIGQTEQALRSWLLINPEAEVTLLSTGLSGLSADQQQGLLSTSKNLAEEYPRSHQVRYLVAQMSSQAGDFETAQTYIDEAISLDNATSYQLFLYQLYVATDNVPAASSLIADIYNSNPNDQNLAVQYARHLFRYQRDDIETLQVLHSQNSQEPIIARTFARAAFENGEFDLAEGVFLHLAEQGYADESYYFLGLISLENQLPSSAIGFFAQVQNPPYLSSSLIEWLQIADDASVDDLNSALNIALSIDPDQFETYWRIKAAVAQQFDGIEAAYNLFDDALSAHPNHPAFLYEQALLAASLKRFNVVEQNLVEVLRQQPDNANALNALGYTWADLNQNLPLANEYIDLALAQEPDNPAFMDSKGWVLYRLGDKEAALRYLQLAYEKLAVDEVAAHIAEVLWQLGRTAEAKQYLDIIRELNAESKFIIRLEALFREQ